MNGWIHGRIQISLQFCNENFSPWKRLKLFDFVHRTVRTCLIYLISGIGGNLVCGLFNPLSPQVSEEISFKDEKERNQERNDDPFFIYHLSLVNRMICLERKIQNAQGACTRSNILESVRMEKKIVLPGLDVIMIAFFPRNIHWTSLFARKARVNTERVHPVHLIVLLQSIKFNMARH